MQAGRDIKFRGKRSENGEWVYGNLVLTAYGCYIIPQNIYADSMPQFSVDPKTVGQFTGFREKYGKEIFEGDIFQTDNYPLTKEDGYVGVVEYDHDRFWGVKRLKAGADVRGISDGMADGLLEFVDESIEVIGNIYEDQVLLEVGN